MQSAISGGSEDLTEMAWGEYALPSRGHLDFESAVTAQSDDFKELFIARIQVR